LAESFGPQARGSKARICHARPLIESRSSD
jgi:hypothetical protein